MTNDQIVARALAILASARIYAQDKGGNDGRALVQEIDRLTRDIRMPAEVPFNG